MKTEQEFVIKKGVLTKYNGPGGDVVIPEGVKAIGGACFLRLQKPEKRNHPGGCEGNRQLCLRGIQHSKRNHP